MFAFAQEAFFHLDTLKTFVYNTRRGNTLVLVPQLNFTSNLSWPGLCSNCILMSMIISVQLQRHMSVHMQTEEVIDILGSCISHPYVSKRLCDKTISAVTEVIFWEVSIPQGICLLIPWCLISATWPFGLSIWPWLSSVLVLEATKLSGVVYVPWRWLAGAPASADFCPGFLFSTLGTDSASCLACNRDCVA